VPPYGRSEEKRKILADLSVSSRVTWQALTPDAQYTWLVPEHADEYSSFLAVQEMFDLHTVGVKTNRDDVVYDWDRNKLIERLKRFTSDYNAEVHRHKAEPGAGWPDHLKWSETLKKVALRGETLKFDDSKIARTVPAVFAEVSVLRSRFE
jgi:predicted helicase